MRRENKLTGKVALAVLVMAAVLPVPVRAEQGATFGTGERLYSWCVSKKKAKQDLCAAYLGGVTDVLAFGPVGAYRACIPQDEVKFSQVKAVMRTWLIENQEKLHYSAVALVARALSEAYPCKQ